MHNSTLIQNINNQKLPAIKQFILATILLSCSSWLTAQSTVIQQDTTQANLYYQESMLLKDGDKLKIRLLEQTVELYKKYDLPRQLITFKSALTYQYARASSPKTLETGKAAIQLAKATFNDELLPELALSYWGLQRYLFEFGFEQSGQYGEVALKTLPKASDGYFDVICRLAHYYAGQGEIVSLEKLTKQVEQVVEVERLTQSKYARFSLYYSQFMLHLLYENDQRIVRYGQQLLSEINENNLEYRTGFIYQQIGLAYSGLGQIKEGIKWIEKGKKTEGVSDSDVGSAFYNEAIAELHLRDQAYEKAIAFWDQALGLYLKDKENFTIEIRLLYEQLAEAYIEIRDYDQAEIHIKQAYLYESTYTPFTIDICHAIILNHKKQYGKGLQYLQQALIDVSSSFTTTTIKHNPSKFETFHDKEWAAFALKTKAELLYNKANTTNDFSILQVAKATISLSIELYTQIHQTKRGYEDALLYTGTSISQALLLLQDIEYKQYEFKKTPKQLEQLFKVTEKRKAINLLETLVPQNLPQSVLQKEMALVNAARKTEQVLETMNAKYKANHKDSVQYYQNLLFEHTRKMDKFQAKMIKEHPNQALALYNSDYIDIATIKDNLPNKAIWIEYTYDHLTSILYIYTIRKSKAILTPVAINPSFFNDINHLQQLLKNRLLAQTIKRKDFIATSHRLYTTLILPIIAELKGIQSLYIVPEQTLFNIPFEVLLPTNDIKPYHDLAYIIKTYNISYHYSATTFFNLNNRPTVRNQTLLAFAPVFKNEQNEEYASRSTNFLSDSLYRGIERGQFVPLPNSAYEVQVISKILDKAVNQEILLEQTATKSNLIKALQKQPYQFIHLATHGLVNFENPKLSALACYTPNNLSDKKDLFFANEVLMTKINVDLVVLSSCESGIGKLIQGEGLIALNRSFVYAGAKNVLFSLWKVNDLYSSQLMIDFYKKQSNTTNYTKALRLAKLQMLSNPKSALPRYWAPFILIGE